MKLESTRERLVSHFRNTILTGVLVLAPLGLTLWVFLALVRFADQTIRVLPKAWQPENLLGFPVPGVGVLLSVLCIWLVGLAMHNYFGRRIVTLYESLFLRVPLVSVLYQSTKQLVETVFSNRGQHFQQVVVVEYPRKGIYCLAFLTNDEQYIVGQGELIGIFLPSTPNPTTGFYLLVPSSSVWKIELTVEEAFKLIMSAGIVLPPSTKELLPYSDDSMSQLSPQEESAPSLAREQ